MPKQIKDLKEFMSYITDKIPTANAKKNKKAPENKPKTVFKKRLILKANKIGGKKIYKLKLRTKKQLLTYITKDEETAKKIMNGLPGAIEKVDLQSKDAAKKEKGKKGEVKKEGKK